MESVEELELPDREKLKVLVPEVVGREKGGKGGPVGGPPPPTMLPPPVNAVGGGGGGNPNDSCLEVTHPGGWRP